MCGIAGYFSLGGPAPGEAYLARMGEALRHRGPDAQGIYVNGPVGMVHQRLSIIDLSVDANQPMVSACGRYTIVFNGEIYNFQSLRKELAAKGIEFRTKSDTEVLLTLYIRDGVDCLRKLNGMFAFAIWDKISHQLFLARDRLGKKPLYIYRDEKLMAFASELKAILELPSIRREIRHDAVKDYFFHQYIPDPKTIFKHVHKLPPGHFAEVTHSDTKTHQYWNVSFANQRDLSLEDASSELLALLKDCVESRLVSDVPLGAFLSGGIDSSAVVAMMAQSSERKVKTCSIGFASEQHNEVAYARQVAQQFATDHCELQVAENVTDNLIAIATMFDEPFADPSLVPTYFVSKLARQEVTVALAGDGGDENFAGYSKYAVDDVEYRMRHKIPAGLRRNVLPLVHTLLGQFSFATARRAATLTRSLAASDGEAFFFTNSFFNNRLWQSLVVDKGAFDADGYNPASVTMQHFNAADTDDHLSRLLYTDIKTYLPGDILVKVDRMSMANSLETRAPLLDYRMVEFAASLPSRLKFHNGEKKYLLKRALHGMLSDEILYRPKMGFSVPLGDWLANELRDTMHQTLFTRPTGLANFFDMSRVKELWQAHLSGHRHFANELWSMLLFEIWWTHYVGSEV